jgi:tetratricopeptide (TPR) repeat protein
MPKLWLVLSFISLINIYASGQNKALFDSLTRELNKPQADTTRIKTLLEIAKYYRRNDGKKAFEYIDRAKKIAESIHSEFEKARICYFEGKTYSLLANYPKAIENYEKALPIFLEKKNKTFIADVYQELGYVYLETSDYKKALDYLNQALELYKKIEDKEGMAIVYGYMGSLYSFQENYKTSNEYLQKSIELGNYKHNIAGWYGDIAQNYYYLGDYKKSLSYFDSVIPVFKKNNNLVGLNNAYSIFGLSAAAIKDYDKAREYFNTSLYVATKTGVLIDILYAKANLANFYNEINLQDSAIMLMKKGLDENKQLKINELNEMMYATISEAYEKKGDYKLAYDYFKKYKEAYDTTTKKLTDEKLMDIQTEWEVNKKKEQIKLMEKDKKIALNRILTYGVIFIIIFISGISFYIYKQLRNREKRLKLKAELDKSANQLDLKNRELTHKAMILTQQEQILLGIKEKLLNVEAENNSAKESVLSVLSNIDIQLRQNTMDDFEKYFIEVHPTFYVNLKQKFPELAPAELKVCALLRLNLNSKEIASITNKTIRSVETIRTNIRKKMGLSKENLYEVMADV